MPRYVYLCKKCQKKLEVTHSIVEELITCPFCKEDQLERIPQQVSFDLSPSEKPGKIVKNHIEEAKREIEHEKENSRKEWKV